MGLVGWETVNNPIEVTELPRLNDEDFVGVSPAYLALSVLPYRLLQVVLALGTLAAAVAVSPWGLLVGVALLTLVEGVVWLKRLAFPHIGYLVRDLDFSIRHGLLSRTVVTIPFRRIQNSAVSQGPLERRYGLATLMVSSARGGLTVPGLPAEDAARLRAFLATRASIEIEDDVDGA